VERFIRKVFCTDMRVTDMDLSKQKFGRLQPISSFHDGKMRRWNCVCDCGKTTTSRCHDLVRGNSTSCGCLNAENRLKGVTKHGMSYTRQYGIWHALFDRCYRPACPGYKDYGARGITICDRWKESFENFWEDMKDGYADDLTIERKDSNGNYEPSNCRWATRMEQQNNRRSNRRYTALGFTGTAAEWGRRVGLPKETIISRIKGGWSVEKAVTEPRKKAATRFKKDATATQPTTYTPESQTGSVKSPC
jgi:hypothetical protein